MDDDSVPQVPSDPPLGERIAKLEGIVEAEDKLLERGLQGSNNVQVFIIGVIALLAAAAVALFVYVLQRLDAMSVAHH